MRRLPCTPPAHPKRAGNVCALCVVDGPQGVHIKDVRASREEPDEEEEAAGGHRSIDGRGPPRRCGKDEGPQWYLVSQDTRKWVNRNEEHKDYGSRDGARSGLV